jgi:hypothetical protein
MLHCHCELARKEGMLVEINVGLGIGVWNGNFAEFGGRNWNSNNSLPFSAWDKQME